MKHKVQRGFSIITAIFLLVVLAALGAMMVTFFAAQQQSSAIDILGSRAYQAARAGLEWGAFQITQSQVVSPQYAFASSCVNATSAAPATPTTQLTLAVVPLSSVSVTESCYVTAQGVSSVLVYNVTASAIGVNGASAGGTDFVERVIQVTIDAKSGIVYQRENY